MGWGEELHGRGNQGGGLRPQEKQGFWGGKEEEGQTAIGIYLCMGARDLRWQAPLVQATSSEQPLVQATGDWALLVQATGGQAPLV